MQFALQTWAWGVSEQFVSDTHLCIHDSRYMYACIYACAYGDEGIRCREHLPARKIPSIGLVESRGKPLHVGLGMRSRIEVYVLYTADLIRAPGIPQSLGLDRRRSGYDRGCARARETGRRVALRAGMCVRGGFGSLVDLFDCKGPVLAGRMFGAACFGDGRLAWVGDGMTSPWMRTGHRGPS